MLKKIISILLLSALLFSAAAAEQDQPHLIEAQEGETTAMQIRSLESDAAVGILGVESDPQQRRWEDFATVFTVFVKKNWDADVQFSDAIWSNGRWMHLADMGSVVLRVDTTDETPDGLLQEVRVCGLQKNYASDVQVITAAAYWAAAQYGAYGKYVMQIVFMEDHDEDWFTKEPAKIWIENGYQLSFSLNDMDCPLGRIAFAEDLPTAGGYAPFDPKGLNNIPMERTVESLLDKLTKDAENGPFSGMISAPAPYKDWEKDSSGASFIGLKWDDCMLMIYTDAGKTQVHSVALSCMSGDTVSACLHLFPLYSAIASPDEDIFSLLSLITGGHGTWEDMCALNPFCVINGVMLQCDVQKIDGDELPIAYIGGANLQQE